jgi:cytochrome c peroxidase
LAGGRDTPGVPRQLATSGEGFLPLLHVKYETGGMIFPPIHIAEIDKQKGRSLQRFDADFDLPDHLLPEFPPPISLTTRPELGDVSKGQLLTIRNFFALMDGILTPVQMEGLRLLLTPFPQQQFDQADDRKVHAQSLGVTCFDCRANGHTNDAFHLPMATGAAGHPVGNRRATGAAACLGVKRITLIYRLQKLGIPRWLP